MDRASAMFTQKPGFFLVGRLIPFEFILGAMTALALDEGLAFFDPGDRNEKYLKVMIDALVIGLVQTATRATTGILVQNLCFWRYANYKKHAAPV
jgi:hypothetical protein